VTTFWKTFKKTPFDHTLSFVRLYVPLCMHHTTPTATSFLMIVVIYLRLQILSNDCDLFSDLSILILPAVLLNGMGGISYAFTSFSVANLFGNRQSTMISLMMGSYCGSAVFYMLLKVWILPKIRVCKPRKDTQDLISSDVEFLKIVQSQLSDNLQC